MPSAARLSPRRSSCSPAQTRSAAAPPGMWQLSLSQEIGLSKPCSSYSSVWAKSLAIRENSSSSMSMPLRRRTSRSPSSVPDTSPPHPRLMLRVYEHLFVGSRSSAKLISVRHTRLHSRPPDTTPPPSSQSELGRSFHLDPAWQAAQLDLRPGDREIQAVAGEMQAGDLQSLPQRRLDGRDSQPSPRCVGLEAEKRVDDRERRGGAPVLRAAAGLVVLGHR